MRYSFLLGFILLATAILIPGPGAQAPSGPNPPSGARWMLVEQVRETPEGGLLVQVADRDGAPLATLPLAGSTAWCSGSTGLHLPRSAPLFDGLERVIRLAQHRGRGLYITYAKHDPHCIIASLSSSRPSFTPTAPVTRALPQAPTRRSNLGITRP